MACFYNAGPAVGRSLARLAEFDRGAQIVLVDDASTDATESRLREWAVGRREVRVLALEENRGPAAARNAAIGLIDREYVWFVDDDDPEPNALDSFAEAISGKPDLVFARARFRAAGASERWIDGIGEQRTTGRERALRSVLDGDVQGFLWSKLFRRSVLHAETFGRDYPQEDFIGVVDALERSERIVFWPESVYTDVERGGGLAEPGTHAELRVLCRSTRCGCRRGGASGSRAAAHRRLPALVLRAGGGLRSGPAPWLASRGERGDAARPSGAADDPADSGRRPGRSLPSTSGSSACPDRSTPSSCAARSGHTIRSERCGDEPANLRCERCHPDDEHSRRP
ncbi:glycosyltransferase family 2 protein [Leifsonia xyli]|uniref:glycosyltransferase family 2 protein n=1 Tax=Leifsonia xyli TaxID=1575 RepID=UPI00178C62EB